MNPRSLGSIEGINKEIHRCIEEFPYLHDSAPDVEKTKLTLEKVKALEFLSEEKQRKIEIVRLSTTEVKDDLEVKDITTRKPRAIDNLTKARINAMVERLGKIYDRWFYAPPLSELDDDVFKNEFFPVLKCLRFELKKAKIMNPDVGTKAKRAAISSTYHNLRNAVKHCSESFRYQKDMNCHVHQLLYLMLVNFPDLMQSLTPNDETKKAVNV